MARNAAARGRSRVTPPKSGAGGYKPQCSALTDEGQQCRNSARAASKYCASHKGYQPPTTRGLAKRIEGDAWSDEDARTDAQSRSIADTRPAVRKAKDTMLAVRGKAKAARKAKGPTARPTRKARAPRPKATRGPVVAEAESGASSDPGYVATILQGERDYLVVFEEPDPDGLPAEDNLVLDVDAGQPVSLGEVNLEQKLDLELSNNTNWVGRLGFALAIIGALVGAGVLVYFALTYPERWYDADGDPASGSILPATAFVGVLAILTQLAGVVLTHYGRRIQARGNLSRMRIVEKAFQPRVALGDES